MTLVAVRINSLKGRIDGWDDAGDPFGDFEFDDANEEIVYIETTEFASMENGISDIRDVITDWEKYHA